MHRKDFGRVRLMIALGIVAALASPEAQAQEVLFEDDFSILDSAFGEPSDEIGVTDNVLWANCEPNIRWSLLYQSMLFENADISVKVRLPDPTAEQGSILALVFWAQDYQNLYSLQISDSGTYSVWRYANGKWVNPVSWRETDALKTEPGEWNELRVKTVGKRATIYINGKELHTIKGRPPEGGSLAGVALESGPEAFKGEFSAFKAVLPPDEPAAEEEDPNVLYADDFSTLDPGWGSEMGWFGVKDGKLFVVLEPSQAYTPIYWGDVVGDMDASVKCHMNDGNAESVAGAGVVFWAKANDDYWLFELYDNGNIGAYHRIKDRWLTPMAVKAAPAGANVDPTGTNTLRIVTKGRQATFYINGVEAGRVTGQPVEGGSYFGLYCESSDGAGLTHEFSNFTVKNP
jgi:hypothetical protein